VPAARLLPDRLACWYAAAPPYAYPTRCAFVGWTAGARGHQAVTPAAGPRQPVTARVHACTRRRRGAPPRGRGRRPMPRPAAHAASALSANACARPRGWNAVRAATPPSAAGARSSRPIATARNCESGRGHLRAPAARALQRAWRDGARARRCGRPPVLPAGGRSGMRSRRPTHGAILQRGAPPRDVAAGALPRCLRQRAPAERRALSHHDSQAAAGSRTHHERAHALATLHKHTGGEGQPVPSAARTAGWGSAAR